MIATADDFLRTALEPSAYLRRGQAFMNSLIEVRPDLAQQLVRLNMNPFYDDSKLWAAVEHVRTHWAELPPVEKHFQ